MSDTRTIQRKQIGQRLREARISASLTQADAASILGVQRPSITLMESGSRGVYAEEIVCLAELYDVDLIWLLSGMLGAAELREIQLRIAAYELTKLEPDHLNRLIKILATMFDEAAANLKKD